MEKRQEGKKGEMKRKNVQKVEREENRKEEKEKIEGSELKARGVLSGRKETIRERGQGWNRWVRKGGCILV